MHSLLEATVRTATVRTDVRARSTSVRNSTSEIGIDSADVLDFQSDSADRQCGQRQCGRTCACAHPRFGSDSADVLDFGSDSADVLAFGSDSADVLALGSDTSH